MEMPIQIRAAQVVQFSETQYDRDGLFLEFLIDVMRPVIVEDGVAIDIFSHQIFDIVPMVDGVMSEETLASLDRDRLYVYRLLPAKIEPQVYDSYMSYAKQAEQWYHEEYQRKKSMDSHKIISFAAAKQKFLGHKQPQK